MAKQPTAAPRGPSASEAEGRSGLAVELATQGMQIADARRILGKTPKNTSPYELAMMKEVGAIELNPAAAQAAGASFAGGDARAARLAELEGGVRAFNASRGYGNRLKGEPRSAE